MSILHDAISQPSGRRTLARTMEKSSGQNRGDINPATILLSMPLECLESQEAEVGL